MPKQTYALHQHFEGRLGTLCVYVLALALGYALPYALAPYHWWPLSIFAPAGLAFLLANSSSKQAFTRSFMFGTGMFAKGVSWVYISIYEFAGTPALLATIMTAIFVLGLALVFALPFYVYGKYFSRTSAGRIIAFPAIWVLGEWLRSWFLTGFPWLYAGYAHIETPLAGWAPVFGVFSLSLITLATAACLIEASHIFYKNRKITKLSAYSLVTVFACWCLGFTLTLLPSSDKNTESISVGLLQPNVSLEKKWNPLFRNDILDILREESNTLWDNDLVIWPEAAVPMMYHEAEYFLNELNIITEQHQSALITGILYDHPDQQTFYNSILGLGAADGIYFKQRLVPFGEYVPLEQWLRGLIDFFDLPNSVLYPGPKNQEILKFKEHKVAPSICYEIVYPDLVANLAKDASLLVTISNDAWFGSSIGPIQHFQMAQMRALENNRYVIRATNTGLSGIIDARGKIVSTSEQFEKNTLSQQTVKLIQTRSLFSYWGSYPIVLICLLSLLFVHIGQLRARQKLLVGLPG
ncbi:MAG: apolipoprotein N-acyltransferase [Agarilytica sp.]